MNRDRIPAVTPALLAPVQALDALDLDRTFTDALAQAWAAALRDTPGAARFDVCWSLSRLSAPDYP